jgi:hypothetical protein
MGAIIAEGKRGRRAFLVAEPDSDGKAQAASFLVAHQRLRRGHVQCRILSRICDVLRDRIPPRSMAFARELICGVVSAQGDPPQPESTQASLRSSG